MASHEGFCLWKRGFKLFVYSDILENARKDKERQLLIFPSEISFYLASPVDWILIQVAENIINTEKLFLGRNELFYFICKCYEANDIHEEENYCKNVISNYRSFYI